MGGVQKQEGWWCRDQCNTAAVLHMSCSAHHQLPSLASITSTADAFGNINSVPQTRFGTTFPSESTDQTINLVIQHYSKYTQELIFVPKKIHKYILDSSPIAFYSHNITSVHFHEIIQLADHVAENTQKIKR